MQTLFLASLLSTIYIGFLVILEALRRKFGWSPEFTRRLVHVVSGVCTLIDFTLLPSDWFLALISISLVGIAASQYFGWLTSVHRVRRRTFGEVFLPIGTLTTWTICQGEPRIFIPSLLVMTFADSAAGIVSDLLKSNRKVWQGSLIFFAVSASILANRSGVDPIHAVVIALIVTGVERVSPWGSDNATIPISTGLLLLFAL